MKSNNEILNEFGEKVITSMFDPSINNLTSLKEKENPPVLFKAYVELFQKLDENDFQTLKKYLKESMGSAIFNFLKVFEENEQFKIIFEEDNQQVDLNKISEMLKSEPIIENGWIDRFSELIDKTST